MIWFYISLWLKRFSLYKIKRKKKKNRHEAFCKYSGLFPFNVNTHWHDLHLVLYIIKYIMGTCEPRASHLIVQQQKYTLYRTHVWYEWKLAEHVFRAVGPCTVAAAPSLANRYLLPRPALRIFTRFWGERLKDVSGSHVVNSLTVRLRNTMIFFELIQSTRSCFVEASSVIRGSPQHFRSLYFKTKVSKGEK